MTSKINNSGRLSKSLKSSVQRQKLVIEMAEYGLYVDEGRRPGKFPPVDKIKEWIKSKPIKPRDKNGRFMAIRPSTIGLVTVS